MPLDEIMQLFKTILFQTHVLFLYYDKGTKYSYLQKVYVPMFFCLVLKQKIEKTQINCRCSNEQKFKII